ncbi:MAG: hypothetical protein KJ926_04920 [Candidatus Omnitrophica bacterium]|nr:hypothetical protein [Candidatus Omnitrophota bacterium]
MKIFVGNLAFVASQADLQRLFAGFGVVTSTAIVMEKKEAKSRGFGFVDMPDDQEAGAAIASLNGQDFMGRELNVSPALSKSELKPKKKILGSSLVSENSPGQRKSGGNRTFTRGSFFEENRGYKEGRRSLSFLKRHKLSGAKEQSRGPRKNQGNPMRWLKNKGQSKLWRKNQEGSKPWDDTAGESSPREKSERGLSSCKKTERESGPGKKATGGPSPWMKSYTGLKPWRKSNRRPQRPSFRRHKKSSGHKND